MYVTPISMMVRVSERLTDQEAGYEFELYTKTQMLNAFNWAVATASQINPALFLKERTVTLNAGSSTEIGECERIVSYGDVFRDNEFVNVPHDMSKLNQILRRFNKCSPSRSDQYVPQYMGLIGDNTLEVYPPIPDDTTLTVKVQCAEAPQADSEESNINIPTYAIPAIEELMLYYLYDIDNESVPNRGRSDKHMEVAIILLGGRNGQRATTTH